MCKRPSGNLCSITDMMPPTSGLRTRYPASLCSVECTRCPVGLRSAECSLSPPGDLRHLCFSKTLQTLLLSERKCHELKARLVGLAAGTLCVAPKASPQHTTLQCRDALPSYGPTLVTTYQRRAKMMPLQQICRSMTFLG
jgi:hypothetical protein